tara:strand:- start:448 stop:786 length:339 start_codon:yes stop_codon:yes gene_type:complete
MVRYNQITVVGEETNKKIAFTSEEETARDAEEKAWTDDSANRKLEMIKKERNQKLAETDYLANSDVVMSDAVKTWRQQLRDLPQDNSTEAEYDALLATDADGNLTNTVWSKP